MAHEEGILLKQHLGLTAFPKVYYSRVINTPYRVYFIFFDSKAPQLNITSWESFGKELVPTILYRNGERLSMTNIRPIEEWLGVESSSFFIRVDLSGRFLKSTNYAVSEKKVKLPVRNILVEDMHIEDFKSPAAISAMTQRFRTARRRLLGQEIPNVRLIRVRFSKKGNWVDFKFKSISTPNTPKKQKANPNINFELQNNPPKVYQLLIRFNNFFTWLFDTLPDGQALSVKDIKDAMRVCPVQFWSNSPAYHWQGHNYVLSQLDAAIYPTSIAPKHWNKPQYHGEDAMLDKHLAALVRNISFFLNNMTSALNKALRKGKVI